MFERLYFLTIVSKLDSFWPFLAESLENLKISARDTVNQ